MSDIKVLEITSEEIVDALSVMGIEDASVMTDYSGRAMYGAKCFGVVVDAPDFTVGAAMALMFAERDNQELDATDVMYDLCRAARTDNMGRSVIVYFPGYQVQGDDFPAEPDEFDD
jgi:hypothetical protein